MAELVVDRGPSTDEGTFSKATVNGSVVFDWLELPDRNNEPDLSDIPAGSYVAQLYNSPHLGYEVYLLQGVPGRSNCEIHIANWAGDSKKGLYCELEGCAAPGYGVAPIETPSGSIQRGLLNSRRAFQDFMAITKGEKLLITINPYTADIA